MIIRTIQSNDMQSVYDLHYEHYWRSHCLLLNQDFYKWQFIDLNAKDQSIVAVENNRMLGYLGVLPIPVRYGEDEIKAAHLVSWLISPRSQGQGLGLKMMSYMTEHYDFLFGRSVTPAALSVYMRLGFRYFGSCKRWLAILDVDKTLELAIDPSELSKKRAMSRTVHPSNPKYTVSESVFDNVDMIIDWALPDDSVSFSRSNKYLIWRYQNHPYYKYQFLYIDYGIAVLREEKVINMDISVLRVIEFIARSSHEKTLAKCIFSYGIEKGCAFVDLFGMSEHYVSGFVSAGGYDYLEEESLNLPYLFQPLDDDIRPPGLLFFGKDGLIDDMTRLYISRGDGNMDWPSWVPDANGKSYAMPTGLVHHE